METIKETAAEVYPDITQGQKAMPDQSKAIKHKPDGGAAIRRMQEIAQQIYESTPGINDEIPRHTSKIL